MERHVTRVNRSQAIRRERALAIIVAVAVVAGGALIWMHGERHPGTSSAAAPTVVHAAGRASAAATASGGLHLLSEKVAFRDDTQTYGPGPKLSLAAGILVDVDSDTILWEKNPHLPRPPASTTKVLSTLVALENYSPGRLLTITPGALTQAPDETRMGLKAGEQLTVQELLTGMLTVSANDAATALAVDSVGLPAFVATMNAQVKALGLHDSRFTTPVGLDDPNQLASAYDLAAIALTDYNHFSLFRQLVGTRNATLPASTLHPAFYLHNLDQLLGSYPGVVGIKPGYTSGAGGCLIGMAIRNGHRLMSVILGSDLVYTQSRTLLDWGFAKEGLPPALPPARVPATPRGPGSPPARVPAAPTGAKPTR